MNKQEVLDSLRTLTKKLPREALREIQANREEYIPELLESLADIRDNIDEIYKNANEDNYYSLPMYAMYLLAEFREKRAFPYLIELMRLSEDHLDYVFGDSITEDLKNMLLSTFDETDGEHMQMLIETIENPALFRYSRLAAIDTYALLQMEGHVSREDFISYMRSLIYEKFIDKEEEENEDDEESNEEDDEDYDYYDDDLVFMCTAVVGCILDTHTHQMIPDALFLYDNDRVDKSLRGDYDDFLDWMFYKKPYEESPHYIEDTVSTLKWLDKSEESRPKDESGESEDSFGKSIAEGIKKDREQDQLVAQNSTQNIVQKQHKPGRNDPCPCGSGKKYKKCCIDKDNAAAAPKPQIARIEDKYDLMKYYPKDSPLFDELYEKEAVEVDMLAYKALHHRAIPMWVKRDYEQERLGKINYLNDALQLFLAKCEREHIDSFAAYDERYMVHYRSLEWVGAIINLTEDDDLPGILDIREAAVKTLEKFGVKQ